MNCVHPEWNCKENYCGECITKYCHKVADKTNELLQKILDKFEHINNAMKSSQPCEPLDPKSGDTSKIKFGPDNNKPIRDKSEPLRNVNQQLKKRGRPKNKIRIA